MEEQHDQAQPEPPKGYEPQADLQPGQDPGIQERPEDLIEEAEAVDEKDADAEPGDADDNDDEAEDPEE